MTIPEIYESPYKEEKELDSDEEQETIIIPISIPSTSLTIKETSSADSKDSGARLPDGGSEGVPA